jgi:hypothetical protein
MCLRNIYQHYIQGYNVRVRVFNATFNNISVISWRSVLLVKEPDVTGENHFPKYIDKVVIIEIKQTWHTVWIFQYVFICFKNIFGFRHCLDWRNGALEMVCRDNPPPFFCNVTKITFPRDVFNF